MHNLIINRKTFCLWTSLFIVCTTNWTRKKPDPIHQAISYSVAILVGAKFLKKNDTNPVTNFMRFVDLSNPIRNLSFSDCTKFATVLAYLPEQSSWEQRSNKRCHPVYPVVGPLSSNNGWPEAQSGVHATARHTEPANTRRHRYVTTNFMTSRVKWWCKGKMALPKVKD